MGSRRGGVRERPPHGRLRWDAWGLIVLASIALLVLPSPAGALPADGARPGLTTSPPGPLIWSDYLLSPPNPYRAFAGEASFEVGSSSYLDVVGGSGPCGRYCNDSWELSFNGGPSPVWFQEALPSPVGRTLASVVYDTASGELVVFGGLNGTSGALNDTWTRIPLVRGWAEGTGASPPARWGAAFAYDPALGGVVLFGGTGNAGQPLSDTWLFRGDRWSPLSSAVLPPARSGALLFWQGDEDRMVLFGGNGTSGALADTWGLGAGGWYTIGTTAQPPARAEAAGTTDGEGDPVVFGGWGAAGYLNDSWVLYGDNWTQPSWESGAGPSPKEGAFLAPAPDTTPNDFILFWGKGTGGAESQTWSLRVQNGGSPPPPLPLGVSEVGGPTNRTAPIAANFTALGNGGTPPYRFAWDFGDGGPGSTAGSPSHIFSSPGSYLVSVRLQDSAVPPKTAQGTLSVLVRAPNGTFGVVVTATPRSGGPPLAVVFTAAPVGGTAPLAYLWDFGDGAPRSASPSPEHTYNRSGTSVARLVLNDSQGKSTSFANTIEVASAGLGVALSAVPPEGHPPLNVSFHATPWGGEPPYTYLWSFGDGNSTYGPDPNASNVYGRVGNFTVRVMVVDALGANSNTSGVVVLTEPPPVLPPPPTFLGRVASGAAAFFVVLARPVVFAPLLLVLVGLATLRWGVPTYRIVRSVRRGTPPAQHAGIWGVAEIEVLLRGLVAGDGVRDLLRALRPLLERDARSLARRLRAGPGPGTVWAVRRILLLVPQLLIAATVLFFGFVVLPDAISGTLSQPYPQGVEPIPTAWWQYVGGLVIAGWTNPYLHAYLPYSLQLLAVVLALSVALSYPLGLLSGWYRGRTIDHSTRAANVLALSVPIFVIALMTTGLAWGWYYQVSGGDTVLGSLPSFYWMSANMGGMPPWIGFHENSSPTGFTLIDAPLHGAWAFEQIVLVKMLLQGFPIAAIYSAIFLRYARLATVEASTDPSVTGARARGVGDRRLLWGHISRRVSPVYAAIFGTTFPMLLFVQIVGEWLYNDLGLGTLFLTGFVGVGAVVFVLLLMIFIASTVGEGLSRALDPVGRSRDW
ncbi:MAG: PKD domain-containing protein [Euryarchaeota archaeon]|nr:PKD domain-containing protein [Euryarchaeota archaeon]MDE1836857.1 PKD domain-containing protein [Euryarchaeota archaeon]MDE1879736.1 PKD domain-containing protein [Euryarchaeota archaeon]MDE2046041.1 PKD domain-containing protein [Thermoplasmata archaeon]